MAVSERPREPDADHAFLHPDRKRLEAVVVVSHHNRGVDFTASPW
jgi:hypothetical protein